MTHSISITQILQGYSSSLLSKVNLVPRGFRRHVERSNRVHPWRRQDAVLFLKDLERRKFHKLPPDTHSSVYQTSLSKNFFLFSYLNPSFCNLSLLPPVGSLLETVTRLHRSPLVWAPLRSAAQEPLQSSVSSHSSSVITASHLLFSKFFFFTVLSSFQKLCLKDQSECKLLSFYYTKTT